MRFTMVFILLTVSQAVIASEWSYLETVDPITSKKIYIAQFIEGETEAIIQCGSEEDSSLKVHATTNATKFSNSADENISSIKGLLNRRVMDAWIRPPSARYGMQTLLRISFLPNGEVADVKVLKGSGNTAFDNRVVDAVYRVGHIEEVASVDPDVFERNFRKVNLLFCPQDLRY